MNLPKIAVGGAFWFAGIIVPVLQHALISISAGVGSQRYDLFEGHYLASLNYSTRLPAMTWVYLGVMWLVGAVLIVSGFELSPEKTLVGALDKIDPPKPRQPPL